MTAFIAGYEQPHMLAERLMRAALPNEQARKEFDRTSQAQIDESSRYFFAGDWTALRQMAMRPDILPIARAFIMRDLQHPACR
jgi:hypothetical protein